MTCDSTGAELVGLDPDGHGRLYEGDLLGPFYFTFLEDSGVYFEANGLECLMFDPDDADVPECAGPHRWIWDRVSSKLRVNPVPWRL